MISQLLPALGQVGALVALLALTVPLLARHPAQVYTSEWRQHWPRRLVRRQLRSPEATVRDLVDDNTSSRTWGVLGEPHVTVLMLNIAIREAVKDS